MGNILNHNRDIFDIFVNKQDYWDFHLSLKQGYYDLNDGLTENCLISYIDTTDPECVWFEKLYSKKQYRWDESVNVGMTLENIGYTGVDNGLLHYEKDRISNKEFYEIFTNSKYSIDKDDYRLLLNKVNGNNQIYDYDSSITDEDNMQVLKLNGGFYQGFFKLYGYDYQVLPSKLGNGWDFEVTLKKDNLTNEKTILNDVYPENKGIFLYIGTRAENKWWLKYKVDETFDLSPNHYSDEYSDENYLHSNCLNSDYVIPLPDVYEEGDYFADGYLSDEEGVCCNNQYIEVTNNDNVNSGNLIFRQPEFLSTYNENALWQTSDKGIWIHNEQKTNKRNGMLSSPKKQRVKCNRCTEYFMKGYVDEEYYTNACAEVWNMYVTDEYIEKDLEIDIDEKLNASDGFDLGQPNIIQYKTDNKFILFDRTKDGFDINNWNDENEVTLYDIKVPNMENYFILFDRTCNGYTTNNIDKLIDIKNKEYSVLKDIYRNAIAFMITDNGEIGYKYLIKDCEKENSYKIEKEFSNENIIADKEWHVIHIKIIPLQKKREESEKCFKNTSIIDKMKIYIYVDSKLKLISKELPIFNFKHLNDLQTKQEGVPYNISLGGGTQGLCDMITLNYRESPKHSLPLEKEFAGTFIGYIKNFKFYDCPLNYNQIVNNFNFETNLAKTINIY